MRVCVCAPPRMRACVRACVRVLVSACSHYTQQLARAGERVGEKDTERERGREAERKRAELALLTRVRARTTLCVRCRLAGWWWWWLARGRWIRRQSMCMRGKVYVLGRPGDCVGMSESDYLLPGAGKGGRGRAGASESFASLRTPSLSWRRLRPFECRLLNPSRSETLRAFASFSDSFRVGPNRSERFLVVESRSGSTSCGR